MTYFSKFPKIIYSFEKNANRAQLVTDILRRVQVRRSVVDEISFFDEYDIKDGETPEIVSDRFYNTPFYHWLILLVNDIVDPRFDWCLPQQQLYALALEKYGDPGIYQTHHYEVTLYEGTEFEQVVQVTADVVGASSVSNLEHETRENEKRRRIKVLNPKYVAALEAELDRLIKQ